MITIIPLRAFIDNYIWLLQNDQGYCIVVDPGDAEAVLAYLHQQQLSLSAILITHHHPDHIGGVKKLTEQFEVPIFGPASIPGVNHPLADEDRVNLSEFPFSAEVLAIPGHTLDHLAYYGEGRLFCGDTLFSIGCGRLFEGTAEQLYSSLQRLSQLPDDTWVYCAHEYTLNNLRFALTLEPNHPALLERLAEVETRLSQHLPSLPVTLRSEKRTNPFLRVDEAELQRRIAQHANQPRAINHPLTAFTVLRQLKDQF
ncbi:MAG: hydroxyacylglutathione hydrolase [Legionellales bacterium]|nr:hydroxyacylglutathione hydrolase [Legionellales bacterium]